MDISASLPPGIVAIYGVSGSGKTSLLNCLAGLTSPDSGNIKLNGRTLFSSDTALNIPPNNRRIGYMFQDNLLFPHLTVKRNIEYGCQLTPVSKRRIDITDLVELLELTQIMGRNPGTLSAGERQRVVLARALATSPDLLLLDEPLSTLHVGMKGKILRYLKTIDSTLSIPMIYVSHSMSEIIALAGRTLVINDGTLLAFDDTRKILTLPQTTASMEFEQLENLFEATIVSHQAASGISLARVENITLALPYVGGETGRIISIAIRACDIILATERPSGISARNIIAAHVEKIHYLGTKLLVHARIGNLWLAEVTPDAVAHMALKEGQDIHFIIKSSSITVLG